jgi:hypothetical protein
MNMSEFDKYIEENHKVGDVGSQGDSGLKTSHDTHDFDYEFESSDSPSDDGLSFDYEDDQDDVTADDFKYLTDYEMHDQRKHYDKQYERLFDTYKKTSKKSKVKSESTFSDDEIAGFDYVKSYYIANMEAKQITKEKQVKVATLVGFIFLAASLLVVYSSFYNMGIESSNSSFVYVTQNEAMKASEIQLKKEDFSELRSRIQEKKQLDMASEISNVKKQTQQEIKPVIIQAEQPVIKPVPSVVNNYNFDKLNSGLATLGYSLLACFAAFVSFKGLSSFSKSFKLKREIKKSKQLIHSFNLAISNQDNQLAISQHINDQIVINNILIDRLQNNNNVVELMAVNEKMKDTSQFINNNLISNLKEI